MSASRSPRLSGTCNRAQRCATAAAWLAQLQATRDGFAALPVNDALSDVQPAPVAWDPV